MNLDFTFNKYRELCEIISNSEYIPMTMEEYFGLKNTNSRFIILRHDVDSRPERALKIAEIERDFGLRSTYYFRVNDEVFQQNIIEDIQFLGHEIGYHYEVLDKANGDVERAIRIFKEELEIFRKICDIKSICMHGNSRTSWDNRDVWKKYDFNDLDILGEAYLSVDFSKLAYFSDSSRSWEWKYKMKDIISANSNGSILPRIKSTDEIIDSIKNESLNSYYILTHPDEWSYSFSTWMKDFLSYKIKNIGKAWIVKHRKGIL